MVTRGRNTSLTNRVFAKADADNDDKTKTVLKTLKEELPEDCHI